jgi:hypothetical protein
MSAWKVCGSGWICQRPVFVLFFCYVQSFRVWCTKLISLSREPTYAPGSRLGRKVDENWSLGSSRGFFFMVDESQVTAWW